MVGEKIVFEYVDKKLKNVGLNDLPISKIYDELDWDIAKLAFEKESILGVLHILSIGFANGVNFEKSNKTSWVFLCVAIIFNCNQK